MASYNATLIQDAAEFLNYINAPLAGILTKYPPNTYLTQHHVTEWIIREEIEVLYGLNVIGHNQRLDPHRKIHNKLDRALTVSLSSLFGYYIKAPRIYDNPFIQVDLKHGTDLYIQFYRHGTKSDLRF
jgi:hypothetical protein